MGAVKKIIDKKALQALIPFNALSPTYFTEVVKKTAIDTVRAERYLFREGERDNQSVYILEGEVNLLSGKEVVGRIVGGSDAAQHPIAHQQPRRVCARAKSTCVVARIDSNFLDIFLTWDQSAGYEVQEIGQEQDDDWMTRMLQSQAFLRLPPSNIQRLLMRVESVSVNAGEEIIRQGSEGDYFYIIKSGCCLVSRRTSADAGEVSLAELAEGDVFGEEALVADARRNATVTMTTDGTLMRLAKADFIQLLKEPLVNRVNYAQALAMVAEGAAWLDVRLPEEFENSAISGSCNIPLSALRHEADALSADTRYIVCCDTGRRSESAAFVLSQRGLDVHLLVDGLSSVPPADLTGTLQVCPEAEANVTDAEVYELESKRAGRAEVGVPRATTPSGDSTRLTTSTEELQVTRGRLEETAARAELLQRQVEEREAVLMQVTSARDELQALAENYRQELDAMRATARDQTFELEQSLLATRREVQEAEANAEVRADELQQLTQVMKGTDDELIQSQQQIKRLEDDQRRLIGELEESRVEDQALRRQIDELLAFRAETEARERAFHEKIKNLEHRLEPAGKGGGENSTPGAQRLASLQAERAEYAAELQDAQLELGNLRTENAELASARDGLAEEAMRLRRELESRDTRDEEAEQERQAFRDEVLRLTAELQNLREMQEAADRYATESADWASEARQQLADLQAREGELCEEIATLKAELDQARSAVELAGSGVRDEANRLRLELENAVQNRDALEQALKQSEDQIQRLELAATGMRADQDARQSREADSLRQIQELTVRVNGLLAEKGEVEAEIRHLEQDLAVTRDALVREQRRVDGEKARHEQSLARASQAAEVEIARLHEALDDAEARAEAAERELGKVRQNLDGTKARAVAEHAALTAELAEFRQVTAADIDGTHHEIQRLRNELEIARRASAQDASEGEIERLQILLDEARDQVLRQQCEAESEIDKLKRQLGEATSGESLPMAEDHEAELNRLDGELRAVRARFEEAVQLRDKAQQEIGNLRQQLETANARASIAAAAGVAAAARERDYDMLKSSASAPRKRRRGLGAGLVFGLGLGVAGAGGLLWFGAQQNDSLPVATEPALAGSQIDTLEDAAAKPAQSEPPAVVPALRKPAAVSAEPSPGPVKTAKDPVPQVPPAPVVREFQDRLKRNGLGPVMVALPGGEFVMGSGSSSLDFDEQPRHTVTVAPFAVGKYEVTFDEYDRFADDTGRARPDDKEWGRGRRPVINVSWHDARAYAEWLSEQTGHNYRLPSESEWEYVAAAGSRALYWWGANLGVGKANCFNCGSQWDGQRTAPVGSFAGSAFAIHDTAGNVGEWVQDCYMESYQYAPDDGSAWLESGCAQHVTRGGSFSSAANALRTTKRGQQAPESQLDTLGFRLARDL